MKRAARGSWGKYYINIEKVHGLERFVGIWASETSLDGHLGQHGWVWLKGMFLCCMTPSLDLCTCPSSHFTHAWLTKPRKNELLLQSLDCVGERSSCNTKIKAMMFKMHLDEPITYPNCLVWAYFTQAAAHSDEWFFRALYTRRMFKCDKSSR